VPRGVRRVVTSVMTPDPRLEANNRQVGGEHYRTDIQHWDYVAANNLDYFQGQITKYVTRWKKKGGIKDLEKARHFLDKYIELAKHGQVKSDMPYTPDSEESNE